MARKSTRDERPSKAQASALLQSQWKEVVDAAEADPATDYVNDIGLRSAVALSINHKNVSYRFCLPVQLLGKITNHGLDALSLQRGDTANDAASWDARSLASKVIAPFNLSQEAVLGPSGDPYVGKPMRSPRMRRDDRSKKDVAGWNVLIDVLEAVETRAEPAFSETVFKQVLLEIFRRQRQQRFSYPVPPRIGIEASLDISRRFMKERSGGDRALAIAGALFDLIGEQFGLYVRVDRARINASDKASGQAADLECIGADGGVRLAVEVKDRALTLADLNATVIKARNRAIGEILFLAARASGGRQVEIQRRMEGAYASGQSVYRIDLFDLVATVLALVGAAGRINFVRRVGEHLDKWATQPSHRQAWKRLLESL